MADDVIERPAAGLLIRIDRLLCVGFGDCVDEAPDAFALDDEGLAAFVDGVQGAARERLLAACEACPVDALVALDEDGRVVAPERAR